MNRSDDGLTLVLDIGKSRAKLLMFDPTGTLVQQHTRENRSVESSLGYPALDVAGLQRWMVDTLRSSPLARHLTRAIASTHGAAFVALGDDGLAWDPIDYEFVGVDDLRAAFQAERDDFSATLAPDLPAGLNAARQLYWMQRTHPDAWARTCCLLPYAQFWAWWLSGVPVSEVSSLGCHTQLWRPLERRFSDMACRLGWARLFAPIEPAWRALGPVRGDGAGTLGFPATCEVYAGVHDSNACLARFHHGSEHMTLVSSGTWIVVMAPDAPTSVLDPQRDMLANVSVRGEVVPTARFMGGREHEALCAGAPAGLASLEGVAELIRDDVHAMPSFARQGGPFATRNGRVLRRGEPIDIHDSLSAAQRASLAALYCAEVTSYLLDRLDTSSPVVVEGPFSENAVYMQALATLIAPRVAHVATDAVEGTARGAWMLAHADALASASAAQQVVGGSIAGLENHRRRWLTLLRQDDN
jgi:sugar (pentulose or hexulose) kinase